MDHIGLFEGIGGFSLAASRMGWRTIAWCEINPFCQRILKYYWPNAAKHEDITKTDFSIYRGRVDILTGGFPCQPYSTAGKRLGKEDPRHLWPQMLRAIREIQPRWIVGENVHGIINWSGGLVFEEVQSDLENEGYKVLAFILPAVGVNAPHKRDRVWFVGYSEYNGLYAAKERGDEPQPSIETRANQIREFEGTNCIQSGEIIKDSLLDGCLLRELIEEGSGLRELRNTGTGSSNGFYIPEGDASNSNGIGLRGEGDGIRNTRLTCQNDEGDYWRNFPTQSPICNGNDGIFTRSHNITFSNNRNNMDRDLVTKLCLDEGRLRVDFSTGKIYSLRQRGKENIPVELNGSDCNGYVVHGIRYNGFKIQLRAHQIVWIAANGLYDKSILMIDHINRNRKDNRLENLRLVDAKGNRDNATPYTGKLTESQKDLITWLNKEDGIPIRELAEDFGISKSRAHQIISEHNGIYGITFSKWRQESIKAGGNAIVPQVALQIFKAIEQYEKL